MTFTAPEPEYLAGQVLGRLATVGPDGSPQNSPVAFTYNADTQTIDIGGYRMGATRKFRNVAATGRAAFVVDDILSLSPWHVRGIEIRGRAEALTDATPPRPGFSNEVIRIHPRRVIAWGLDQDDASPRSRNVEPTAAAG